MVSAVCDVDGPKTKDLGEPCPEWGPGSRKKYGM